MQEKRYMNVMVVGGGGREHAIIKKLKENQSIETIYALPGNGGIAADAVCVDIGAKEIEKIAEFAVQKQIDLAVVAPDIVVARDKSAGGQLPADCLKQDFYSH